MARNYRKGIGVSTMVKLTETFCERAQPALVDGKPHKKLYWDTALRDFGLAVGIKRKLFITQRQARGKTIRLSVGRFGELTVAEAREKARKVLAQMSDGINPRQAQRAAADAGMTLRQALEEHIKDLTNALCSPRTIQGYRYTVERYLKDWLDRPLAEITGSGVRDRHERIRRALLPGNTLIRGLGAARRSSTSTAPTSARQPPTA